jgi:hypothetical protein
MSLFQDRVLETTNGTGTGALTLAGSVTGYRSFSQKHILGSANGSGELISYVIEAVDGNKVPTGDFEIGYGQVSSTNILSRFLVLESSNANALVNFAAGSKLVYSNGLAGLIIDSNTDKQAGVWSPAAGATVPAVNGFPAFTAIVAATGVAVATTSRASRMKRLRYSTTATAGNVNGVYMNAAASTQHTVADGSSGGFFFKTRFTFSASVTTANFFCGLRNITTAPTSVNPATITNSLGLFSNAAANLSILGGGGTAGSTNTSLGAGFPTTGTADLYEFTLISPRTNSNSVLWNVERIGSGVASAGLFANGVPGTTMPAANVLLGPAAWISNNATAAITQFDLGQTILHSEF